MPHYIIRVELRGTPSGEDYKKLHAAMLAAGYPQTIVLDGIRFYLPHAEYALTSTNVVAASEVNRFIRPVINAVWSDYLLLVSRADEVSGWLVPVK
jgi:hypothetical protein